jgi:hypothetical protein
MLPELEMIGREERKRRQNRQGGRGGRRDRKGRRAEAYFSDSIEYR